MDVRRAASFAKIDIRFKAGFQSLKIASEQALEIFENDIRMIDVGFRPIKKIATDAVVFVKRPVSVVHVHFCGTGVFVIAHHRAHWQFPAFVIKVDV